jgi:dihydroorotate dehydrogenase
MTGRVYDRLFDGVLTRVDAERAHRLAFGGWRTVARVPGVATAARRTLGRADRSIAVEVFGKVVPSPLGLAAGFDKNAVGIDAMAALGFGAVEVGTVTGQPQPGNPRPRLFRLPTDRAIVNRMGFNNDGSYAVAARLAERATRRHPSDVLLGVNIGRTKVVPEHEAVGDYRLSAGRLAPFADYLVVNVSSPNTPGLRDLQAVSALRPLLAAVHETADAAAGRAVPLLVKIAPDLADEDVRAVAGLVGELGLAGVVATNTTIGRDGLRTPAAEVAAVGAGGLSGPVLAARSEEVLHVLRDALGSAPVVISVGGVTTAADVARRLDAGATLVQGYTALVYEGPLWPRRVNHELAARATGTLAGAGEDRR